MTEAINIFKGKRSMNAAFKDVELNELQLALEKFAVFVNEKVERAEAEAQEQKEKKETIKAYLELMAADGISIEDISALTSGNSVTRPRSIAPPKYEYLGLDGEMKQWTGRGRMPKVIAEAIERGASLEDYLIQNTPN